MGGETSGCRADFKTHRLFGRKREVFQRSHKCTESIASAVLRASPFTSTYIFREDFGLAFSRSRRRRARLPRRESQERALKIIQYSTDSAVEYFLFIKFTQLITHLRARDYGPLHRYKREIASLSRHFVGFSRLSKARGSIRRAFAFQAA